MWPKLLVLVSKLALHKAEETADDAHGKQAQNDDDGADVFLEQLAAQKRQQDRSKTRDEGVEVVLQGRDLLDIKTSGTQRRVLLKSTLDALGATLNL